MGRSWEGWVARGVGFGRVLKGDKLGWVERWKGAVEILG